MYPPERDAQLSTGGRECIKYGPVNTQKPTITARESRVTGARESSKKLQRAASLEVCLDPDAAYTHSMPGGIPLATCRVRRLMEPDGACASPATSAPRAATAPGPRSRGGLETGASKVRALAVTSRYTPLLGKTFDVLVHAKPQCA
jgi:hypothetical protein